MCIRDRLQVGRSVYDFYMKEWAGVDPDNGKPLWYADELDADDNPTGKRVTTSDYASADYYYVNKSSLPKDVYKRQTYRLPLAQSVQESVLPTLWNVFQWFPVKG